MKDLFSLGEIYISDFTKDGANQYSIKHDLKLVMEEDTGAVRLATTAPLNRMFGRYFYRSGVNETMVRELKSIVESILSVVKLKDNDIFLDIASNDGTLLSFVPKNLIRIGIDPAEDSYKDEAKKHSNLIIQDFFSAAVYRTSLFGKQKAKVITAIAMFYDLDKPDYFLKDIYEILDDEGLFVMQLSHSGLMIKQMAFDNILSEHVYYYCLNSLRVYLDRNRLKIVDCQLNDTNGGSFRVYIMKDIADKTKFTTAPNRDVCKYRIESLLKYEEYLKLDVPETWMKFYDGINALRDVVVSFIKAEKANGKTVWAYGASTKGNTLLGYFGLDHTLITACAERSTHKWGLKTSSGNIPIVSEAEFRKAAPDYVLILPWHFVGNFIEREAEYLSNGGKFICPCPQFKIIGK